LNKPEAHTIFRGERAARANTDKIWGKEKARDVMEPSVSNTENSGDENSPRYGNKSSIEDESSMFVS